MLYIKQITVLRFLAACLVVVVHFGQHLVFFQQDLIATFIQSGAIIVSFFFFLSGTVLGLNYLPKPQFSSKTFYIKRLARVYPIYLLAFVFTLFMGMHFNNAYPKGISIILQLFSLHSWYPGICLEINFPSWTVAVEVFFYLLFPLLLKWFKRLSFNKAVLWVLLIWILSGLHHFYLSTHLYLPEELWAGEFVLYFPLWHLNCFLFGMLCARYVLSVHEKGSMPLVRHRIWFVSGSLLFFVLMLTENPIKPHLHNGLMAPVYFIVLSGLSLDKSLLTKFLSHRFFLLLGNTSYAFYIFQWPIFIAVSAYFETEKLDGQQFALYFFLLLIFSILIYLGYEKKMRKYIIQHWLK